VVRDRVTLAPVGIFNRGREPAHSASVIYVYDKHSDQPPYYSVVCRCGWSAEPVEAQFPDPTCEQQMASAALAHDPAADTTVGFPLDEPSDV
jgi:hypothetical protein